ncbi:MAG: transporter substrate-binding domain-containing protein [Sulfuritalea sp.]|nr:transporter substrate-binding domain-containing protein [Sulfuritalea sp.]
MLVVLAASLAMLPTFSQAKSACPSLLITGHPAYMPVAWAADGKIVGAAPELVTAIAGTLGVKTVTSKDYGSWEKAQTAVRKGEADVIFGIYKNATRKKWLDFIEPAFMQDPVAVVVRQGEGFDFAQWSDLKGRKGVTNVGESFGDKFDGYMKSALTVARAQGVDKAFAALLDKSADYLIIGLYPGQIEARKLGIVAKVQFLPKEVDSFGMYVGFSKKSKCNALKAGFGESLRQEIAAGRVQPLLDAARRQTEQ